MNTARPNTPRAKTGVEPDISPPTNGLLAVLRRLDRRLARTIEAFDRSTPPDSESNSYRGLYLSQADVRRSLQQDPDASRFWSVEDDDLESVEPATLIGPCEPSSRFARLANAFRLSPFDLDVVLIALAPEFDPKYEQVYAYLQDDVSRKSPSVDLALNLLCRSAAEKLTYRASFAPDSRLLQGRVIRLVADPQLHFPAWPIRLDDQIIRFLLFQRGIDGRLSTFCRLVRLGPNAPGAPSSLSEHTMRSLAGALVRARKERQPLRLYFQGAPGAGQSAVAARLAHEAGAALLSVDLARWAAAAQPEADERARVLLREAQLLDAVLYLEPWDALVDAAGGRHPVREALVPELAEFTGAVILSGEHPWEPIHRGPRGVVPIRFDVPPYAVRRACWKARAEAARLPISEGQLDALAGLYRLNPDQIGDAVAAVAATHPTMDRFSDPAVPATEAFFCAARAQSGHDLARLARRVELVHEWGDLVLDADVRRQLREVCQQVRNKRQVREEWGFGRKVAPSGGTSALFSGASGTGKTTSASIIARELHLELYEIDLSCVVSKYIGETEKNLRKIFDAAVNSNAILQFNEVDALMGKRSEVRDAHDRYANIEIAFLLQEMERFDGVAILTTNLRQNIDEAFTRRLDFVVEFPFPDEAARRQIWEVLLPPEAPRKEIDFDLLARLRLSGGNIKNAVYAAAFYAAAESRAITTGDLVQAVRREHQKMGRLLNEAELGPYANTTQR
jgi:SpoVK/Ycf46/Vps4 family AAA+-type ATPase